MKRRTVLAGAGAGLLGATAGCMDIVSGGTIEYEARGAQISDAVREEAGYEYVDTHEITIEEPVSALGISRDVAATNIQTEYEKYVSLDPLGSVPAAAFSLVATPSVSFLGREFNPVENMSNQEIAEMIQDNYDDMGDLSYQESSTQDVGGEDVSVSKYLVEARLDGMPVELTLLLSDAVSVGDDLILAFGAYPRLTPNEEAHIHSLMAAVEPI